MKHTQKQYISQHYLFFSLFQMISLWVLIIESNCHCHGMRLRTIVLPSCKPVHKKISVQHTESLYDAGSDLMETKRIKSNSQNRCPRCVPNLPQYPVPRSLFFIIPANKQSPIYTSMFTYPHHFALWVILALAQMHCSSWNLIGAEICPLTSRCHSSRGAKVHRCLLTGTWQTLPQHREHHPQRSDWVNYALAETPQTLTTCNMDAEQMMFPYKQRLGLKVSKAQPKFVHCKKKT